MKDKAEKIHERLQEIVDKFKELKQSGVDEELMVIFIMVKTKFSKRDVHAMLHAMEEFYDKLIGKLCLEAL